MTNVKTMREPLFRVSKRTEISLKRQILTRVIAVLIGLMVSFLLLFIVYGNKANPIVVIKGLFQGAFGTPRKRWVFFRDLSLLLGVGLALIPAFKMRFWNLGGNGQILIGALITYACMRNFGGKIPDPLCWLIMFVFSILGGAVWAVIPAIFKSLFKTNESLFTLMMNYIATGLTAYFIKGWSGTKGSGSLSTLKKGLLPSVGGNDFLLIIISVAVICVFMFSYMKYSKHGYEIAVVGESENTARYVGMNVKKVIIRTLVLSGALCGIIGFFTVGAKDHSLTTSCTNDLGFTAIIAVWIAKMDPIASIGSSFGIVFITNGVKEVQEIVGSTNDSISKIVVGILYFCIIGCEFFINYAVAKRNKKRAEQSANDLTSSAKETNDNNETKENA